MQGEPLFTRGRDLFYIHDAMDMGTAFTDAVHDDDRSRHARCDRSHMLGIGRQARLSDGRSGVIVGIAEDGALILQADGTAFSVHTGEVRLSEWGNS